MSLHTQTNGNPDEDLVFACSSCGLRLSISRDKAGVSGPCPSCGTQISAPASVNLDARTAVLPPEKSSRKRKSGGSRVRINADAVIDRQHQDWKETSKTLMIITVFILTICACLAVTWFLRDSIQK